MSPINWVREIQSGKRDFPPAGQLLGLRMIAVEEGSTTIEMPIGEMILNRAGGVQGGILASLADANMGTALGTLEEEDETHATLELKINFLRPAPAEAERVIATSRVIHRSRRIAHVTSQVTTPDGTLICHATSTWAIRRARAPERE